MTKYRKKPVVIEAFQYGVGYEFPDWFEEKIESKEIVIFGSDINDYNVYCEINTLEGAMRGNYGDFIIKGVNNEIYPCKPDIFRKTYEKVEDNCDGSEF